MPFDVTVRVIVRATTRLTFLGMTDPSAQAVSDRIDATPIQELDRQIEEWQLEDVELDEVEKVIQQTDAPARQ